ncbi:MAG: hypothetical protein LAO23_05260 [Acidobacteriia bacterium]|nr:hypothetical protein [Terriglobia bacterium]
MNHDEVLKKAIKSQGEEGVIVHKCQMPLDGSAYIKWDTMKLVVDKVEKGGNLEMQVWGGLCGEAESERCGRPAENIVVCKENPEVIHAARGWTYLTGCGGHHICDSCMDRLWGMTCVQKQ